MRISDWSSDVCSSDLTGAEPREHRLPDEMARTGADRAADHDGKQAVHGFALAGNDSKAKAALLCVGRHQRCRGPLVGRPPVGGTDETVPPDAAPLDRQRPRLNSSI